MNKCLALTYDIFSEIEKSFIRNYISKSQINKISPAIEYIHAHYLDSDFSCQTLPEVCNMGYTYFRKIFINQFNLTPSKYVLNLRLEKACELLRLNRFSITQISEMTGYSDVYYFSKQFKKVIGIPPSKYNS